MTSHVTDIWLLVTYWKENSACRKCTQSYTQSKNKHIFNVKWQYLGPDLSCWKSVEHYPKTELWLRYPVSIGAEQVTLLSSLYMKRISYAFHCVLFIFGVEEIWHYSSGRWWYTLGVSSEVCCPLTPEQPALLCFFYIVFPHLSMTMLIGNSLTVSSNVEKGIGTFCSSSHILMLLYSSKKFLFSFLI